MKLYRNEEGKKLYPVCSWEQNQHKLYNAYDRATIRMYESEYSEEACNEVDRVEQAMKKSKARIEEVYNYWTGHQDKSLFCIITL